jgi:hypothetical protein
MEAVEGGGFANRDFDYGLGRMQRREVVQSQLNPKRCSKLADVRQEVVVTTATK